MSLSPYQPTEDDVETILRSYVTGVTNADGKSFEDMAIELLPRLDFKKIEKAALHGNDLDTQTEYANDEIVRQLREKGVLEDRELKLEREVGLEFSESGKAELARITGLLREAQASFAKLSDVENKACFDRHGDDTSLNHCIRWGLQSAEDLNAAVGNPDSQQSARVSAVTTFAVLANTNDGVGVEQHDFATERERTLWLSEQDDTFDDFYFLDVQGVIANLGIAKVGKEALEDDVPFECDGDEAEQSATEPIPRCG